MSNQEKITDELWESKNKIVAACRGVNSNEYHFQYKSNYEWLIRIARTEADHMEKLLKQFNPPTEDEN